MVKIVFKEIENLMLLGDYEEALDVIAKHQLNKQLTDDELFHLLSCKCISLNCLGDYEETIKTAQGFQIEAKSKQRTIFEVDARLFSIFAFYRLNKIEQALKNVEQAEKIIDSCSEEEIDQRKSRLLADKALLYASKGEVNQALALSQENHILCQKMKVPHLLARAQYICGIVHNDMGENEEAIDYFEKSLEIREKLENQYDLAHSLFRLGYSWRNLGVFDTAYEYFNRSLKIRKKIRNQQDISWTLLNIGDIHFARKELKKAQQYFDESLLINQTNNFDFGTVFSLRRLSMIYEEMGNPQLVIDTLEKALNYAQVLEMVDPEAYALFDIINFITCLNDELSKDIQNNNKLIEKETREYIKEKYSMLDVYLNRLSIINYLHKTKLYNQIYRLARALILKSSDKAKDKQKARRILEEITEEDIIYYIYTIVAMSNYSDLLADELKKHLGEEGLVSELTDLSHMLSPEQSQRTYAIAAESFLHQTKTALEEIDIAKARELLRRAQNLNNFLVLYNKGPTPFRILYILYIKETNLNELSNKLGITKGALTNHLKLLTSLNLVKISKEKQIRSATMLKKYYSLGEKGMELIQRFNLNIIESISEGEKEGKSILDTQMTPRLLTKMIRDVTYLIDKGQNFVEEHILTQSFDNHSERIYIDSLFLTKKQYKIYIKLWDEFREKVQNEVISENTDSPMYHSIEKPTYIAHLALPLRDLIDLERFLEERRRKNEKNRKNI
ncbi:MAG: tetratricopeptide repeat protein [Asgard group archaeon]|nr:tetratricopeptide repeat protein [Asgard group archaeon]